MRVLMFQDRFVDLVCSGAKRQTIRAKARCKAGDDLSLRRWTGKPYRSKQEVIREAWCVAVHTVEIRYGGVAIAGSPVDADGFASLDGFKDFGEMELWFGVTHGLPFDGQLIRWC